MLDARFIYAWKTNHPCQQMRPAKKLPNSASRTELLGSQIWWCLDVVGVLQRSVNVAIEAVITLGEHISSQVETY